MRAGLRIEGAGFKKSTFIDLELKVDEAADLYHILNKRLKLTDTQKRLVDDYKSVIEYYAK